MQEMAEMEMHDVELVSPLPHFRQHRKMRRHFGFLRARIKPKRAFAPGTSFAEVRLSPLANSVTSWPRSTSASVR